MKREMMTMIVALTTVSKVIIVLIEVKILKKNTIIILIFQKKTA